MQALIFFLRSLSLTLSFSLSVQPLLLNSGWCEASLWWKGTSCTWSARRRGIPAHHSAGTKMDMNFRKAETSKSRPTSESHSHLMWSIGLESPENTCCTYYIIPRHVSLFCDSQGCRFCFNIRTWGCHQVLPEKMLSVKHFDCFLHFLVKMSLFL